MEDFTQHGHESVPTTNEKDFDSSPNVLFTAKSLVIKRTFTADDNEVYQQSGQRLYFKGIFNTGYTTLRTDYLVGMSSTSLAVTVTLPPAATAGVGKTYLIKDIGGSATTNNITIDPDSSETIDGQTTKALTADYASYTIVCDGSQWYVI